MTVPVVFAKSTVIMEHEDRWRELNAEANGHPEWPPITIKAAYVLGVIHDTCESVDWLLKFPNVHAPQPWPTTYLPAVGLCLTGIDLLGRCLLGCPGHDTNRGNNLREGITYLFATAPRTSTPGVLAATNYGTYNIDDLIALRHYAAHGQATTNPNRKFTSIDIELLDAFPQLIGNALDRYWNSLQNDPNQCDLLGAANILPLRSTPIRKIWELFSWDSIASKHHTVTDIFMRFDWQVYK